MENKELADLVQQAVDELHKAVERQDDEIKKLGNPTAETKEAIDKINAQLTDLDVKMQRQSVPSSEAAVKTDEEKSNSAAFYKWVRGGATALNPEERKALVEDSVGQYLITPDLESEIERTLPEQSVIRPLASVRKINKDRLKIRSLTEATVGWGKLETGTDITEGGLVPGAPTYQYTEDLYGLIKIGEDELDDSDFNLAAILADSFSRAIAAEEDSAFVIGRGHTTYEEPTGITKEAQLITDTLTGAASGAVIIEDFLQMVYAVPQTFRKNGSFIVNSATELAIRELRSETDATYKGMFLWQPSLIAGAPNTFLGYPIYNQDDMKKLSDTAQVIAIFGDVKAGYRIIDRKGITIQRLTELYSEAGLVGFKVHKRVGGGTINAAAKALALLTEHA